MLDKLAVFNVGIGEHVLLYAHLNLKCQYNDPTLATFVHTSLSMLMQNDTVVKCLQVPHNHFNVVITYSNAQ